jgi:hypothetical protein
MDRGVGPRSMALWPMALCLLKHKLLARPLPRYPDPDPVSLCDRDPPTPGDGGALHPSGGGGGPYVPGGGGALISLAAAGSSLL